MSVIPQTTDASERKKLAQQAKLAAAARQALGGLPG